MALCDRRARLLAALLILGVSACGGGDPAPSPAEPEAPVDVPVAVPSRGDAGTLDVATWNIEWFGDSGRGPANDQVQAWRVRDVIVGADLDLWGLQEITSGADFADLLVQLPAYDGFLADNPLVEGGAASYSDFDGNEQKVGLIWRRGEIEVLSADIVLTESDFDFAGRPPLRVRLRSTVGGGDEELVVLVLHAKASTDAESWERRRAASVAMKAWLDENHPEDRVVVLGDFNDDLDESIRTGSPTPYRNFLDDPEGWSFVTEPLTLAGQTSTIGFDDVIDHILVSNEVDARYEEGSAEVFRLDRVIAGYGDTTSDHYPVLARFAPGG
jgi:endonuclease/exonuclease/phosphatase family metal-dependent hydrolase